MPYIFLLLIFFKYANISLLYIYFLIVNTPQFKLLNSKFVVTNSMSEFL